MNRRLKFFLIAVVAIVIIAAWVVLLHDPSYYCGLGSDC